MSTPSEFTFTDYLRQCSRLVMRCYSSILVLFIFSFLNFIFICVGGVLQASFKMTATASIASIIVSILLEIFLYFVMIQTITLIQLDAMRDRPLKLWSLLQRAVSPELLVRTALLSMLWIAPYLVSALLIYLPTIAPSSLHSFQGHFIISFMISVSYLLGLNCFFVTPFVQLRWVFANLVMIHDNCSPMQAIQQSVQISRYFAYWRIAGVIILNIIFAYAILFIPVIGMIIMLLLLPFYAVTAVPAYQRYLETKQAAITT